MNDNDDAFHAAVRLMREAQRAYFKNRTTGNLNRAKVAERMVDRMLEEQEAMAPELFGVTP